MKTKPQHSSSFIAEMRKKLVEERKQLEKELEAIAHKQQGEYKATFPDYGRQDEDNAAELSDFQSLAGTEVTIKQRLENVQAALHHIEHGTYGLTEEGELIPEERLRANPAAITTVIPQKK